MTPNQSKTARNLLGLNQGELADKARVSKRTVAAFESGDATRDISIELIENAFEEAGITFVDNASEIGVLLAKKPRRGSAKKDAARRPHRTKRL
jgi:transcriptional regulator with XRE-family HTH domain